MSANQILQQFTSFVTSIHFFQFSSSLWTWATSPIINADPNVLGQNKQTLYRMQSMLCPYFVLEVLHIIAALLTYLKYTAFKLLT